MIEQINVGVIGTGWCGGIRTKACSDNPLVDKLFIAEINDARRKEVAEQYDVHESFLDLAKAYFESEIDTIIISATPETTHYPMALAALKAGKNVFMEKPIATTLEQADELIQTSIDKEVKFTIGYSQRFNSVCVCSKSFE